MSLTTWPGHMQANLVLKIPTDLLSYRLRVETSSPILKFVVCSKIFSFTRLLIFGIAVVGC